MPTLLQAGHYVRVIDRLDFGGLGLVANCAHPNFTFALGDINDPHSIKMALNGVDVVLHLAAVVGYPACLHDPSAARQVNVDATRLLLGTRSREQRLLFASTGSAYGATGGGECREETPPQLASLYASTKLAGERSVLNGTTPSCSASQRPSE